MNHSVGFEKALRIGAGLLGLAVLMLVAVPGAMRGQEARFREAKNLGPDENSRFTDFRTPNKAFVKGNAQEADNLKLLGKAAEWYVYRLTWSQHQSGSDRITMNELVKQALSTLPDPSRGLTDNQAQFLQEYGKVLTQRCQEVLKNPKPIARISAARVMAGLAERGHEEVADALVDVIKDPKQLDAVKLYALRGLKDLFVLGQPDKSVFQNPAREEKCVQALLDYLKAPFPKELSPEEIEGRRWVRREALRALGFTRNPGQVRRGRLQQTTALDLLKVARRQGVTPPPNLSEQVEAAIAVCQLQPKLEGAYHADYAARLVGEVVVEFLQAYGNRGQLDLQGFAPVWRYDAVRLDKALGDLRTNVQRTLGFDLKGATYVDTLVGRARDLLQPFTDPNNKTVAPPNPAGLQNWLGKTPVSNLLFKNVAEAVVPPPPEPGEGATLERTGTVESDK